MRKQLLILFWFYSTATCFSQVYDCKREISIDSLVKNGLKTNIFQSEKYSDDCKMLLIANVGSKFIETQKTEYIRLLVKLSVFSDGMYTMHLYTYCGKIFDNCLHDWFVYLYKNQNYLAAIKLFNQCVSERMSVNPEENSNVNQALDKLALKLNPDEKKYLSKLRKDLNPNLDK